MHEKNEKDISQAEYTLSLPFKAGGRKGNALIFAHGIHMAKLVENHGRYLRKSQLPYR